MASTNFAEDLLDEIFAKTSLEYLSDLHRPGCCGAILDALADIPAEPFSARSWKSAAEYILKRELECDGSPDEWRKLLMSELSEAMRKEAGHSAN